MFSKKVQFVPEGKLTVIKVPANTLVMLRGRKLTDDKSTQHEFNGYSAEVVLGDLPFDNSKFQFLFGSKGTHQSVMDCTPEPKIIYHATDSLVKEYQVFGAGKHEFTMATECGESEFDRTVTLTLDLDPKNGQISIQYGNPE